MPRGKVWPTENDTVQAAALLAMANSFAASDSSASALISDALPSSTINLLVEWEESLGLPDPCAGPNPSDDLRRAQVVARFGGSGGQSRAFFMAFAATLGFEIAISNHAPFRVGYNRAGDGLYGQPWSFVWIVTVLSSSGSADLSVLQCEFERLTAAETVVLFSS